jgi:hypothetical protein
MGAGDIQVIALASHGKEGSLKRSQLVRSLDAGKRYFSPQVAEDYL